MNEEISAELKRSADTISRIDPAQIRKAADILIEAFRNGGQAIFMGNGGSSADAQHIAAEFSGRYMLERPALPGVCLSNIAPVTAIGNDYSYDLVFKRQIEGICRKGDVVIGMSTSGNSKNVILAMEAAKERGAITISFTGDGGRMREIADHAVVIPSKETPRIQEGYLCACHTMCGIVERELFGQRAVLIDRDDTIAKDVPYCDDPVRTRASSDQEAQRRWIQGHSGDQPVWDRARVLHRGDPLAHPWQDDPHSRGRRRQDRRRVPLSPHPR